MINFPIIYSFITNKYFEIYIVKDSLYILGVYLSKHLLNHRILVCCMKGNIKVLGDQNETLLIGCIQDCLRAFLRPVKMYQKHSSKEELMLRSKHLVLLPFFFVSIIFFANLSLLSHERGIFPNQRKKSTEYIQHTNCVFNLLKYENCIVKSGFVPLFLLCLDINSDHVVTWLKECFFGLPRSDTVVMSIFL